MFKKFLKDYFSYQLSHILGGRKYSDWAEKNLTLYTNTPIKNKLLAKELEEVCLKKGFLTYSEFLTIDQFGKNGYHSTHSLHGMTDTNTRWPEALAALCKKKDIHNIVEFGPGNGEVGLLTIQEGKKIKHEIFWSGVEINEELRQQTLRLFKKKKLEKNLLQNVSIIKELSIKEKCLFVFSYSLDNLIPDIFINTLQSPTYPNAMIGVKVKDNLLSEIVILGSEATPESNKRTDSGQARMTGSSTLLNGLFKDSLGFIWNLRQLRLNHMQRAYLPLVAFRIIIEAINKMPVGSQILIIDEFRESSHLQTYHLGLPRDLETFSRDFLDFEKFCKTSGSNLLYFPIFLESLIAFLSQVGFSLEEKMGEHKLAYSLSGRNGPYPKNPRTFALLTNPKRT